MKVSVPKIDIDQLIQKLDELNKKCRMKRSGSPYGKNDARSWIFELLSIHIQNWLLNVTLSKQLCSIEFYKNNGYEISEINDGYMDNAQIGYLNDAKNSFFLLVFIQLENYFRLVANAKGISKWKITELVEEIIDKFNLNINNIKLWEIIRNLRNSMHNGGFFNHKDDKVSYKKKVYDFKKNQPINYGNPSDYIFLIEELIENLIVELNSKSSNIEIIEHNYANISFEREE